MFSATFPHRLLIVALLAGCNSEVSEITSPRDANVPTETQKHFVSAQITIATDDPPDSSLAYTLFINNRSERLPHSGTVVFTGLPRAQLVLKLADVPRFCWVEGGPERLVTATASDFFAIEYRVVCHKPGDLNTINLPAGRWRALSYEFSLKPDFEKIHDDLIAAGAHGMLVVEATSGGGTSWLWTQTYRWWPGQKEEFRGSTTFDPPIVNAVLKSVESPFECDWADCTGPLNGATLVESDGVLLTLTQVGQVEYWTMFSNSLMYRRVTLIRDDP